MHRRYSSIHPLRSFLHCRNTGSRCDRRVRLRVRIYLSPQVWDRRRILPPPRCRSFRRDQCRQGKRMGAKCRRRSARWGTASTRLRADSSHPRWLYVLPNGDVLVAETNAPKRPEDGKGIRGLFFKIFRRRPAAQCRARIESRCCATRDGDGVAEIANGISRQSEFAIRNGAGRQHVSTSRTATRSCAFPYTPGETRITATAAEGRRSSRRNDQSPLDEESHREPRRIEAVRRRRLEQQRRRERDCSRRRSAQRSGRSIRATGAHRVFASGLRNPVGLAWEPRDRALWVGGERAR